MCVRSVRALLKNLSYKGLRSLRPRKRARFIVDAKLIFRSAVGQQRSLFFLNVNPETSELLALVSFLAVVYVCAPRELHGVRSTPVGRRIVHSHVIIHRSPSLRFRPRILRGSYREGCSTREFYSSASRQAGYCRIPLRDLSRLVEASKLSKLDRKIKRDGDEGRDFFTTPHVFSAIVLRDSENGNGVQQSHRDDSQYTRL